MSEMIKVPIPQKMTLTIREAAEYSNIGINKIDQMRSSRSTAASMYVGRKMSARVPQGLALRHRTAVTFRPYRPKSAIFTPKMIERTGPA